jgi:hypothetical protein
VRPGTAYGLAFPAAISGIVIGSVIAYALAVMRGADDAAAAVPVPQPAVADAVPAR